MNTIGTIFILLAIYALASSAGLFAEKSGIINLAIEGGMILGALAYVVVDYELTKTSDVNFGHVILGYMVAIIVGILASMMLAFGAINLRGDQVVIGTAINILAPVLSLIVLGGIFKLNSVTTGGFQITSAQNFTSIPPWSRQVIIGVIILLIVFFVWFLIDKTNFGLRLKAAGENPHSLAAVGISVVTTRYFAMIISGGFMGMAGALCVSAYPMFLTFNSSVYGMGFIAIAILILGQWKVWGILLGALLFAVLYGIIYEYIVQVETYSALLQIIPYVMTITILPVISKFARAPQSVGIPYHQSLREK